MEPERTESAGEGEGEDRGSQEEEGVRRKMDRKRATDMKTHYEFTDLLESLMVSVDSIRVQSGGIALLVCR